MRCAIIVAALFAANSLAAQPPSPPAVRIVLEVDDASSQISSLLRTELSALPDVELVSRDGDAMLHLRVLVACVPTCRNVDNYNLAVVLSSPTSSMLGAKLAASVLPSSSSEEALIVADSTISEALAGTERVHQLWIFGWPRLRYELAAREFVRTLDADCFDKLRAIARSVAASLGGNQAASRSAMQSLNGRKWVC